MEVTSGPQTPPRSVVTRSSLLGRRRLPLLTSPLSTDSINLTPVILGGILAPGLQRQLSGPKRAWSLIDIPTVLLFSVPISSLHLPLGLIRTNCVPG